MLYGDVDSCPTRRSTHVLVSIQIDSPGHVDYVPDATLMAFEPPSAVFLFASKWTDALPGRRAQSNIACCMYGSLQLAVNL